MRIHRITLVVLFCVIARLCAVSATARETARPFTVAAASDLQFAFTEIGQRFEKQTGQKVIFSFGSTGNLTRQIENGAPFDLFAAANEAFIRRLETQKLTVAGTRQLYAIGRIVVAGNKTSGAEVKRIEDLLDPRIKKVAIANPEHAPYGFAAREALMKSGLWERIQPKLVLGENIRQTLQFIQTGNAEAGIVALSVANVPEISYRLIDSKRHSPLRQALALIKGTPHEATARRFVQFVNGPQGRPIMRKYGFQAPNSQ